MKSVDGGLATVISRHPYRASSVIELADLSWPADGSRLYYLFRLQAYSVARTGGAAEVMKLGRLGQVFSVAASPDGKHIAFAQAAIDREKRRIDYEVWVSSATGAAPRKIASNESRPLNGLTWSPNSSHLFARLGTVGGYEPVTIGLDGSVRKLPSRGPRGSLHGAWLPGSSYLLMASSPEHGLTLTDIRRASSQKILPSADFVGALSVSGDGGRVALSMGAGRAAITEIPLDGSAPRSYLRTRANVGEMAWSPDGTEFAYVYGEEIRIRNRAGTAERTVVSHRDFPGYRGTIQLEKPSFSPDGQRLLYTVFGYKDRANTVWISPVSGGAPVEVDAAKGYSPVWVSNGAAILFRPAGSPEILRYRLGSSNPPELVFGGGCDPAVSPDGKWVLCPNSQAGTMAIVSLETKESRVLTTEPMVTGTFSRDGASIYAVRRLEDRQELVQVDLATSRVHKLSTLPADFDIRGTQGGPTRMTLSPDGKSVFTTVRRNEGDIWLLEGFHAPRSFWERLWSWNR